MNAPNFNYKAPRYSEFEAFRDRKTKWKGIWITNQIQDINIKTNKTETRSVYECSICSSKFYGDALFPTKYCPNCGAKMEDYLCLTE